MRDGPIHVLEIGSWVGSTAISWAEGLKAIERAGGITCVDPWLSYFDLSRDRNSVYAEMNDAARSGDAFKLFQHNIAAAGHGDVIDFKRMPSSEIPRVFPASSFDVVFIDGDHRYQAVAADTAAARRVLRSPGIICGDDLELQIAALDPEEHRNVLAADVDSAFSERARRGYHPGVSQAVAEAFPAGVSEWHGFWAVWFDGSDWRPLEIDATLVALPRTVREAMAKYGT